MFALIRRLRNRSPDMTALMGYLGGNDDEVTAPLQIASFNGSYPYPEDFDGSTQIGEQVAYWQSHSGDIGGVDPV